VNRPGPRLVRDRLTVASYSVYVMWGWFLYSFGPAVPLLAEEHGISLAQAGLHGTALAIGTVLAGVISATVARRAGRRFAALLGLGVTAAGILLLLTTSALPATLTACLVAGAGGNLVLAALQPALVLHHGPAGPAAVTEGNALGAVVGLLAPLAVGATVGLGWGWRPAVALILGLGALTAVLLGGVGHEPALDEVGRAERARPVAVDTSGRPTPFGRTFWLYLVALVCGVAIEFATTFWAAALIRDRTGAPAAVSTAAVSALVLGMAVSRFVLGPLSLRYAPSRLLLATYGLAFVGFAVLWLSTSPAPAVAGLVLAGLGYGAMYPVAISLALQAAPSRPDQAQAALTIGGGAAIGAAPFVLGALADAVGAHRAFILVPVLLVAGALAVALAQRSARRAPALTLR